MPEAILYAKIQTLGQDTEIRFEELQNTSDFREKTTLRSAIEISLNDLDDHRFINFWEIAQYIYHGVGKYASSCLLKMEDVVVQTLDGDYTFDAYFSYDDGYTWSMFLKLSNTDRVYQMRNF